MPSPESDPTASFSAAAQGLAKNPLGVIALFIVLVYGLAALVIVFASSLTASERILIVIFLVTFPVLVLGVFVWLVTRHSQRLYAPQDFRDEDNWVKMQLQAVASLAAAKKSDGADDNVASVEQVVEVVRRVAPPSSSPRLERWRSRILWVDDRPDNNIYERRAFEALGFSFVLALSTAEALEVLESQQFAAIISDMGRKEGPKEGYVLLDTVRNKGIETPFFVYAGSGALEHKREVLAHGGNGTTNRADELFEMITDALSRVM